MFESFPKSIDNTDKKVEGASENIEFAETLQDAEAGEMELGLLVADLQADIEKQVDEISGPEEKESALKILSEFKESTFKSLRDYALIAALALPGISNADTNKEASFIDYESTNQVEVISKSLEDLEKRVHVDDFETMHIFFGHKKGELIHEQGQGGKGDPTVSVETSTEFDNKLDSLLIGHNPDELITITMHNHPASVLLGFANQLYLDEQEILNSKTYIAPPSTLDLMAPLISSGGANSVEQDGYVVDINGTWKYEVDKSKENFVRFSNAIGKATELHEDDSSAVVNFLYEMNDEVVNKTVSVIADLQVLDVEIVKQSISGKNVEFLIKEYIDKAAEIGYTISYHKNDGTVFKRERLNADINQATKSFLAR